MQPNVLRAVPARSSHDRARGPSSQSHTDYATERTASRPGSQQPRPREGLPANPTLTMQPNVLRAGDGSRSVGGARSGAMVVVSGCAPSHSTAQSLLVSFQK